MFPSHDPDAQEKFEKNKVDTLKYLRGIKDDLTEVFNNLDDCFFNIKGEEAKIVKKVRNCYEPKEVFSLIRAFEKSMKGLYGNPARIIDQFKARHFTQKSFTNLILDTVQLDVFKTENQANALRNTIESEMERLRIYCRLYQDLYRTVDHYVEQMIELIEGSNDHSRDVPES